LILNLANKASVGFNVKSTRVNVKSNIVFH